jgi:hypothetical protein
MLLGCSVRSTCFDPILPPHKFMKHGVYAKTGRSPHVFIADKKNTVGCIGGRKLPQADAALAKPGIRARTP